MQMLGKYKIQVNTSSLADGDSLASYLVAAAGILLTSTTIGGKEYLDAKGASEYAEDSVHGSGDYGTFVMGVRNDAGTAFGADGDYVPLSIDANGALRVNATVNFAGDYAEDSAHTSTDVGLHMLAVRKDAAGSNVDTDGDYASLLQWSNGEMKTVDIANAAILQQRVQVASTATALPTTALTNRKSLMIQNPSANSIWIGSATVTTSGAALGIEVPRSGFMELEVGPAVTVYGIKNGVGTLDIAILEAA